MTRETYTHNRALPCPVPHCKSDSIALMLVIHEGTPSVTMRCRCCNFTLHKQGEKGTEPFRAVADTFANWNNQTMRGAA